MIVLILAVISCILRRPHFHHSIMRTCDFTVAFHTHAIDELMRLRLFYALRPYHSIPAIFAVPALRPAVQIEADDMAFLVFEGVFTFPLARIVEHIGMGAGVLTATSHAHAI